MLGNLDELATVNGRWASDEKGGYWKIGSFHASYHVTTMCTVLRMLLAKIGGAHVRLSGAVEQHVEQFFVSPGVHA